MKSFNIVLAIVFVVLSVSVISIHGYDDCLDVSVSKGVTSAVIAYDLTQPNTTTKITTLIQNLFKALTSVRSPFAIEAGVGYDDNDFYSIQSCSVPAAPCAYVDGDYFVRIVSNSTFGDYRSRYFSVDYSGVIDINNVAYIAPVPYFATLRPWYNANGWSALYLFSNLDAVSRTYEVTLDGAHVISDRLPTEPCDLCRSRSPAILIAPFVADQAPLASFSEAKTLSDIEDVASYLLDVLTTFQLGATVSSVGVGFSNGDAYFVTDCLATSNSIPECNSSRYVVEARNGATFPTSSENLHIFAISAAGAPIGSPRDEGVEFNTTSRPWYLQGNGWTDYYNYANAAGSVQGRAYAASFKGGVVTVDSNPSSVCYTHETPSCPTPTPSPSGPTPTPSPSGPTPTPSPSGPTPTPSSSCSAHGGDDDSVSINFYFADMLRGL